jgi:hypothetical protein
MSNNSYKSLESTKNLSRFHKKGEAPPEPRPKPKPRNK